MEGGLLSLKWNNHRTTFFHVLSTIRKKQTYSDITLACDGKFYPVHKLVLSTCSEYFEQIFEHAECRHPVIVLKDIGSEDLEALLNYMYLGEVNVLQEKLSSLIKAAECLKIRGLAVPDEDVPPPREKRSSTSEIPEGKRRKGESDRSRESPSPSPSVDSKPVDRTSNNEPKPSPQPKKINRVQEDVNNKNQSFSDTGGNKLPDEEINSNFISEVKKEPEDVYLDTEDSKEDLLQIQASLGYNISNEASNRTHERGYRDGSNNEDELNSSQELPGVSGVQMKNWDSNDSLVGASYDNFPEDDGNPNMSQMVNNDTWNSMEMPCTSTRNWTPQYENLANSMTRKKNTIYQCHFCPKVFYQKHPFIRHLRTHTGEKPYLCQHCPYQAGQSGTLFRHMATVHGIVRDKPTILPQMK